MCSPPGGYPPLPGGVPRRGPPGGVPHPPGGVKTPHFGGPPGVPPCFDNFLRIFFGGFGDPPPPEGGSRTPPGGGYPPSPGGVPPGGSKYPPGGVPPHFHKIVKNGVF